MLGSKLFRVAFVMLAASVCSNIAGQSAWAQTFSVIHSFSGGAVGATPDSGLAIDRGGSLYGTTLAGGRGPCNPAGIPGCGTVFKLSQKNSGWIFEQLYSFTGQADGAVPYLAGVTIGPNGSLYGVTIDGGGGQCPAEFANGCGVVYNLQPPASVCKASSCPWTETPLYAFQGSNNNGTDGASPIGNVVFDQSGNIYGTTFHGGTGGYGTAYELTHSRSGWSETQLWNATLDLQYPAGTMIFDSSGNLYGTSYGSPGAGGVWELTPSGPGWLETTIYAFSNLDLANGLFPAAGVIRDQAGNLYGTTVNAGTGGGGTAFELSPSGSGWSFSLMDSFTGVLGDNCGPYGQLVMDGAGNLYGTTYCDGQFGFGSVFELTPSGNGQWTYISLHDFRNGDDGANPSSYLVSDSSGNLYGTAVYGGTRNADCQSGCGVVFKITP